MSFPGRIKAHFELLTPSQQHLANYILSHSEQVAFMTARQLAATAGMSDAAVIRFAKALGYEGYPHMRKALRVGLIERAGASGIRSQQLTPSTDEELRQSLFDDASALLGETAKLNDCATVGRMAALINQARQVWVTAHGTTYPLGCYLARMLQHVSGKGELFVLGAGDMADRLRHISSDDVLIGIGYERYLPYTLDIMEQARLQGARVLALTDRVTSPLAAQAVETLYVARSSSPLGWWSQTSTMMVIDWLIAQAISSDEDNVKRWLERSDDNLKALGLWKTTSGTSRQRRGISSSPPKK